MTNNTIWKFQLPQNGEAQFPVALPGKRPTPLRVDFDPMRILVLWAAIDKDLREDTKTVIITIVGTGHPLPENAGTYMNTFTLGVFVFHAFYRFEEEL